VRNTQCILALVLVEAVFLHALLVECRVVEAVQHEKVERKMRLVAVVVAVVVAAVVVGPSCYGKGKNQSILL
jgi:F0F1-type ATP synthase membrane subunit c/vacuolar-type H+-ATPase subunit K